MFLKRLSACLPVCPLAFRVKLCFDQDTRWTLPAALASDPAKSGIRATLREADATPRSVGRCFLCNFVQDRARAPPLIWLLVQTKRTAA
jgi:hypothetical protein